MQWPSERVRPGGIFQPAKIKYSPETKNFLKVLMEESKLTMQQRQKVNYVLRSGDSLPSLNSNFNQKNTKLKQINEMTQFTNRPVSPKRRMYNTIVKSGAYEREKYMPKYPIEDRNKSIERLQNIMYYGKDVKPKTAKAKKKKSNSPVEEENTFEKLQKEVEERKEWLAEMEKLGEGEKYRQIINQQIVVLLNQMEKLNVNVKDK